MKVVEHDGNVVVEAPPWVEVEAERPAADQRDGCNLRQPEERKFGLSLENTGMMEDNLTV